MLFKSESINAFDLPYVQDKDDYLAMKTNNHGAVGGRDVNDQGAQYGQTVALVTEANSIFQKDKAKRAKLIRRVSKSTEIMCALQIARDRLLGRLNPSDPLYREPLENASRGRCIMLHIMVEESAIGVSAGNASAPNGASCALCTRA